MESRRSHRQQPLPFNQRPDQKLKSTATEVSAGDFKYVARFFKDLSDDDMSMTSESLQQFYFNLQVQQLMFFILLFSDLKSSNNLQGSTLSTSERLVIDTIIDALTPLSPFLSLTQQVDLAMKCWVASQDFRLPTVYLNWLSEEEQRLRSVDVRNALWLDERLSKRISNTLDFIYSSAILVPPAQKVTGSYIQRVTNIINTQSEYGGLQSWTDVHRVQLLGSDLSVVKYVSQSKPLQTFVPNIAQQIEITFQAVVGKNKLSVLKNGTTQSFVHTPAITTVHVDGLASLASGVRVLHKNPSKRDEFGRMDEKDVTLPHDQLLKVSEVIRTYSNELAFLHTWEEYRAFVKRKKYASTLFTPKPTVWGDLVELVPDLHAEYLRHSVRV